MNDRPMVGAVPVDRGFRIEIHAKQDICNLLEWIGDRQSDAITGTEPRTLP